jgi:hypothetical protein
VRDIEARKCVLRAPQWIRPQCRAPCSAQCVPSGGKRMETLKEAVSLSGAGSVSDVLMRKLELSCCHFSNAARPGLPTLTIPNEVPLPGSTKIHSTPPRCIALKFCIVPHLRCFSTSPAIFLPSLLSFTRDQLGLILCCNEVDLCSHSRSTSDLHLNKTVNVLQVFQSSLSPTPLDSTS